MAQTTLTSGDATNGVVVTSGNDNSLVLQTGPAGAKVNALTLDSAGKGTLLVPPVNAAAPAFSAYQSSAQTLSSGVAAKLQFQTEEFDVTAAFDATTNYRFTPQVAGYYQVTAALQVATTNCTVYCSIYKNGASYKVGSVIAGSTAVGTSALVFLNGSTDYVEAWGYASTGQALFNNAAATYFQAALISRSA